MYQAHIDLGVGPSPLTQFRAFRLCIFGAGVMKCLGTCMTASVNPHTVIVTHYPDPASITEARFWMYSL